MFTFMNGFISIGQFVQNNYLVLLFYIALAFIVIKNKHKFDITAGFIALLRTKWGLKLMDKYGKTYVRFFRFIGYLGIVVGFVGMIAMVYFLAQGVFSFFLNPAAPAQVGVVLPGIKTGSPLDGLGLFRGLIIIFMVAAFHEFGHGVVSVAHKIRVKASGIVFFGPIIGAFVEPDDKKLYTAPLKSQLSMFSAGPMFNVILFGITIGLVALLPFTGFTLGQVQPAIIDQVMPNSTFDIVGINSGETILQINEYRTANWDELQLAVKDLKVNDTAKIITDKQTVDAKIKGHPLDATYPYLGITAAFTFWGWLAHNTQLFLMFLGIISLGIGLANLLPFGPLDGGRMLLAVIKKYVKNKDLGPVIFSWVSTITLLLLLTNIFWPILRTFVNL